MGCTTNSNSIDLSVASGVLEADLVVDPAAGKSPNQLVVDSTGVYVPSDGWVPLGATLAYSSADAPTFVATTSLDLTSFIGPGDRLRLVQSATNLYFLITAITAGTVTLYGGTDYTLANSPITVPYFSKAKSPIGFPLDPAKWTQTLKDVASRLQTNAVNGTWYNPGSGALSISLPIGCWSVGWRAPVFGASNDDVFATLSTANNSESNTDFSTYIGSNPNTITQTVAAVPLTLAAKTPYYLNVKSDNSGGSTSIGFRGDLAPIVIRALSAYL